MTPQQPELVARGVYRAFGARFALKDVTIDVRRGATALLGPNNAGKTTLLRILATLDRPDNGALAFAGRAYHGELRPLRAQIGYMAQECDFPPTMTSFRLLRYLAHIRGQHTESAAAALRLLGLEHLAHVPIGKLSGGQRRLVSAAQALMVRPALLLLDEPTRGLAPEERLRFWQAVSRSDSQVVLFSSHIPAEVEAYAKNVIVLCEGEVVFVGSTEALRAKAEGSVFEVSIPLASVEAFQSAHRASQIRPEAEHGTATLRVVGLRPKGVHVREVEPGLEDAYLLVTSR